MGHIFNPSACGTRLLRNAFFFMPLWRGVGTIAIKVIVMVSVYYVVGVFLTAFEMFNLWFLLVENCLKNHYLWPHFTHLCFSCFIFLFWILPPLQFVEPVGALLGVKHCSSWLLHQGVIFAVAFLFGQPLLANILTTFTSGGVSSAHDERQWLKSVPLANNMHFSHLTHLNH